MEKEKDGVWRTIRGRRIFIAKGESLGEAMSKSGKFNRSDIRETKAGLSQKDKFDRTNSQSLKQRQKAIKDFRKKDTRYSNSVYTTDKRDEKNRINENAHIEGSGQTRVQRNWNKYSEEDRREHRHELIQKKLADYRKQKGIKTSITSEEYNKRMNDAYEQRKAGKIDNEEYTKRTDDLMNNYTTPRYNKEQVEKSNKKAIEDFKAKKQSNNKVETERELYERAKNNPESIDPMTENSTDWEALEKKYGKQEETFIQNTNMYGGTREYSKEDLKRMEEAGIRPMKDSYTGGGWEGVNAHKNLSTSEQAKAITSEMKKQFPDVKITRKSDIYSGGSSIDFNIMSSDKDLFVSDKEIDKMEDFGNITSSYEWERWANANVKDYEKTHSYWDSDKRKYAKEVLNNLKKRDIQSVRGDEWFLSDYGKKVVSALNKEANSYTYSDNDGMVDYFNHGTYMHISIGKWDAPYQVNDVKAKVDAYKKRKGK